jgi:hypothetical protein
MTAWNDAARRAKPPEQTERQRAMEAFADAMVTVNKAGEQMMDKHHESVAKSAKKLAEYRKQKARQDAAKAAAEQQKLFHEDVMIRRLNHRNMLEEIRIDELNKEELFKAGR